MENPWKALPDTPPYVLPADRLQVDAFNNRMVHRPQYQLHTELLPEPFSGPLDAPVVVLYLNPGYGGDELTWHRDPEYIAKARAAIGDDPGGHRHMGLRSDLPDTGGGWAWTKGAYKEHLASHTRDELAAKILTVEFFPYHSNKYRPLSAILPSQRYGFHLVASAVERGAVVIAMRHRTEWMKAVPDLAGYDKLVTPRSNRQKALSRGNLNGFELVEHALAR